MAPVVSKVSVVMGVYNAHRFVAATVRSILTQTFADFEFVIVDDGSTDGSLAVLRELASHDSRIKVISRPNTGIVGAANDGIAASRGQYIARHDADDISHPQRLQKQVAFLDANPDVVAVGAQMEVTDPYLSPLEETQFPLDHEGIEHDLLRGSGWTLPQPAAMMRRSAVARVGGYRQQCNHSEDLDLFLRLATVGRLANLPEVLVQWRRHLGSTNHANADQQRQNKQRIVAEAMQSRGLPVPADLENYLAFAPQTPRWKEVCNWGWKALKRGNTQIARRHAWTAIKERPTSSEAWKLAVCSIRGK